MSDSHADIHALGTVSSEAMWGFAQHLLSSDHTDGDPESRMRHRTRGQEARGPDEGAPSGVRCLRPSRIALAAVVMLLSACTLELPGVPYFETIVTIPLGRERLTGHDLAEESEFVFVDSTDLGPLRLHFAGRIDTFRVGDRMDIALPDAEFSASLAAIDFPDPSEVSESFRISELTDLSIPDGGATLVVPAFSIPVIRRRLPAQSRFVWLRMQTGDVELFLQNLLPVGLGVAGNGAPAVGIRLVDPTAGRVLFEASFGSAIPPGGSTTLELDLAGVEFQRTMDLELFGESPGSLGAAVLVQPEDGLDFRAVFRNIEPDSVIALVPAQTVQISDTLDVDLRGDIGIVGGAVLEGQIPFVLRNDLPVTAEGTLTFAELREDNGPLSIAFSLPAARGGRPGLFEGSIPLTGRRVQSLDGKPIEQLTYDLDVTTEASPGVVALGRRQSVTGNLEPAELRFTSVEARPQLTRFEIPPTHTDLDLPTEVAELELVQASLRIVLENTVDFPARANALLRGIADSETVEIPFSFDIEPGSGSRPSLSSFELNETNSDLLRLIRSRPARLQIEGELLVGTDGRTASLERTDWVRGHYEVGAPLRVLVRTYDRTVDDFDFTLSADLQTRIQEDLVGLLAVGEIENHFPLAAETRISFASSLERLEEQPEVTLETIEVSSGSIDPTTGHVIASTRSRFDIQLPDEEIAFFGRDQVFGRISLRLLGDSLTVVTLTGNDFAEITGALEFRVGVGDSDAAGRTP